MNYAIIGSVGGGNRGGTGKDSMAKQFLSQNRRALLGRGARQNQAYMDKMTGSLNRCVQENMTPYWRNHQSLKGWCSMNYPTVLQNPLLKKRPAKQETPAAPDNIKFSNMERPISGYKHTDSFKRPFSTKEGGETLMMKRRELMQRRNQSQMKMIAEDPGAANLSELEKQEALEKQQDAYMDRGLPHVHSMDRLSSASAFQMGRSIQSGYKRAPNEDTKSVYGMGKESFQPLKAVERAFSAFPQKPQKKDKKKLEEEKKLKEEEEVRQRAIPKVMTSGEALKSAGSWQHSVTIGRKFAVGTVATSKYDEKTEVFGRVHKDVEERSNIHPMSNYFGRKPAAGRDPYDRRQVAQLNDISFEDDSEDDFEDVKNVKRQPRTVLTEENLRQYLSEETLKLNLEHHYWLKDAFLNKIGRMAPNLRILSLRRLKISNASFSAIFGTLEKVEVLDISDCAFIAESGFISFLEACGGSVRRLQASNCQDALSDETVAKIASMATEKLEFLDISYAKLVTDAGLKAFEGKKMPVAHLCLNGMTGATGVGLAYPIRACKDTLQIYEGALMDQEELTVAEFGKALGTCFSLESIDVGGCHHITDEFFHHLTNGEKVYEGTASKPGLPNLVTMKMNFLKAVTDMAVNNICQKAAQLQHLEIAGCEQVTEYCLETTFKTFKNITYIDINHIPALTPALYEILKGLRPDLMVRRFLYTEVDPKDNMLRVPWKVIKKAKKKKKGKGKKKKK